MNINYLVDQLKNSKYKPKIVFPEGESLMIQEVANELIKQKLVDPILIFESDVSLKRANTKAKKISIETYNTTQMSNDFYNLRKNKIVNLEKAKETIIKSNYFSTMLLYYGEVDAYLGGITYSTGDTIRPGLQIIKTKKHIKTISSTMILRKNKEIKYFSDIAININPSAEQLADITIQTSDLMKSFNEKTNIVLLSFSTKGSASSDSVKKVIEAGKILDNKELNFNYDYEMQFDAAFDENIRNKKAPNSKLSGIVNGYVFPELNSANIGYKIAQRLGEYDAIGPIITGFKKPINDLSRGANKNEIFEMSIITAIQYLNNN